MAGSDETSHVHDSIFLRAHGHTVSVIEHLFHDLFDRLILITLFTSLDKISVLSETSRIEQHAFAIFIGDSTHFLDIFHGNRLSSCRVVRNRHDNKRNLVSMFCQHFLQFHRIQVSFKRNLQLGILCLVDSHVPSDSLTSLDVPLRGIKVRVTGNDIAFFY